MKEERTAGPLHSAHSMQFHSPHHAACHPPSLPSSSNTFHVPPRFCSRSPPVYALLRAPHGCVLHFSTRDVLSVPRWLGQPIWGAVVQSLAPLSCLPSHLHASSLCPAPCLSSHSPLSATLTCFVNNHLFVAAMAAAITSDLPVSSIMDRLLDVNICKSLLLDSPPGRD